VTERYEPCGWLLPQLTPNSPHPTISTDVALCNIGDRDKLIQRTESAADTELAGRFFFHANIQIDLIVRDLRRKDFHCLEKIQVIEALKAPLQCRGIDDILFVDTNFTTNHIVFGLLISTDVDLPDPHHLPFL